MLEVGLKYFREAAPKHTADEEEDLFPILRKLASPRVSTALADVDRLESEHKTAAAWHSEVDDICGRWLREGRLSERDATRLRELLGSLTELYRFHIAAEEEKVFPTAQAELSEAQKQVIGCRMASRRGVLFISEPHLLSQAR